MTTTVIPSVGQKVRVTQQVTGVVTELFEDVDRNVTGFELESGDWVMLDQDYSTEIVILEPLKVGDKLTTDREIPARTIVVDEDDDAWQLIGGEWRMADDDRPHALESVVSYDATVIWIPE